jgi:hypothetical protein
VTFQKTLGLKDTEMITDMTTKEDILECPTTEDMYAELRDILDDDELSEEKMIRFMNLYEALDNALIDGEPFPEDWLEERQVGGN